MWERLIIVRTRFISSVMRKKKKRKKENVGISDNGAIKAGNKYRRPPCAELPARITCSSAPRLSYLRHTHKKKTTKKKNLKQSDFGPKLSAAQHAGALHELC